MSRPTVIKWLKLGTQPEQPKPTSGDASSSLDGAISKLESQIMAGEIYDGQLDLGAIADLLTKRLDEAKTAAEKPAAKKSQS